MRRKLVMSLLAVSCAFAFAGAAKAEDTYADQMILYLPNRIVDMFDMFSLSLGFGPTVKLQGWGTRFWSFGAGTGADAKVIKGYNRQYGCGLQDTRWATSFMMMSSENTEVSDTTRGVQSYFQYRSGTPSVDEEIYNVQQGPRDIWSLGGEVGALVVEVDGDLHPIDIADFITGWVFIDLKGDDFTMESLRN